MKNLLKNLLISLLLPNLALGQTVVLSTAAGDEGRQPMSASVANKSAVRPQLPSVPPQTPPKTWLRQHAVSVVSVGLTLIAGWYALTLRSENQVLTETNQDLQYNNQLLTTAKETLTDTNQSLIRRYDTQGYELESLHSRFVDLQKTYSQVLTVRTQQGNELNELRKSYGVSQKVNAELVESRGQQAEQLQSYKKREQGMKDQEVSLEAKTKEIQSRLDAVQLREHESQTMRENLETQKKQIVAQKTEADLLIKTLTTEQVRLESLASTFEKLISDNTTLQADLQLKASVVNEQIKTDPTLQKAVTEKKQLERPLFSVFNATKNSTLHFPPDLILPILDLCGFENLKSLLEINKATNQSMKACINTSPAIFFQKVYPSFISLETKPVEIFGVPPLDENLFKEPTPIKLLQSLPKVFKHQDTKKQKHYFLPLPYAKDFFRLLELVAVKHPDIKTIFNTYPLPVWIGPMIKLTPFPTDVTRDESDNIGAYKTSYNHAMEASIAELTGAGTLIRQHPHVLLRTPEDYSILNPENRRDTQMAGLLRTFLEEFLQPYPVTPIPGQHFTQCVSLCDWIYDCMIGYGPGPEKLYAQIRTLCNSMEATQQSAFQTIHIRSGNLRNNVSKTIPPVCKEIVLEPEPQEVKGQKQYNWQLAKYALEYSLGMRKSFEEDGLKPIAHNVHTLRLLNYSFDKDDPQYSCVPFGRHHIPHLIIHVPEGWQLTEDIKAALQVRVNKSKSLKSITLMTAYNGINWHASKQLDQFLKTVTPPQTS